MEQVADEAAGLLEFGARGEVAEGRVVDDLFDEGFRGLVGTFLCGFGQIQAGDLEAVEEETSAAGIDVVGGDAAEDLAEGGLDGALVFGQRELEVGLAVAALAGVGDGFAGGVVVVAEFLLAETGAGTAVAVGEDVAALVAYGFG